jgi:hypothetical protein
VDTIDRLAPLTEEDVKALELAKSTGCLIWVITPLFIAMAAAIAIYSADYGVYLIAGVFALIMVAIAWSRKGKDNKIDRDLREGQKRVIVAPVESRAVNIDMNDPKLSSGTPLFIQNMKESKITGYSLDIAGRTYLVGREKYREFSKGDLAELNIAPHSRRLLSGIKKVEAGDDRERPVGPQ